MRLDWRQVVPAVLVGCLLGLWTGAALEHRRPPKPSTERMLSRFSRDLALDPGQRDSLKAVLESYGPKFDALHEDAETRFSALRDSMHAEIAQLLKPEQAERFQKMQARWDSRHKKSRLPPP
ncbi:MAG: hypothetical protein PHU21_14335 [Elusimicrobia bacterium]|jgi:hypothetical protein|nr:hypothetical protein [Elusimicrobiota bacterium]